MNIDLQPVLEDERVILQPLLHDDFEALYQVASDPEIWAQHPNKERWKKDVFQNFFNGAIQSGGAFKIIDKSNQGIIGSTRFYDYDQEQSSILIGYTFFAKNKWGQGYNTAVKTIMLDYIFQFVNRVELHIGAENRRSIQSIERLGAVKINEKEITYFGESPKLNAIYEFLKEDWK